MTKCEMKKLFHAYFEVFKIIHQQSYQNMDKLNLYPGQPKLLVLIKQNEGITQKELSEKNFVKPATITGMLNKLEANQLVTRIPDTFDKRVMRVYLTEEGKKLALQSELFMDNLVKKVFHNFTQEELNEYIRLTEKMRNNLNN